MTTHDDPGIAPAEVLCIGEAMVAFASESGGIDEVESLGMFPAGAEANVAATMAALGGSVEWFGRLGDDPFGRRILRFLAGRGVATTSVVLDQSRPTGLYFKDRAGDSSTMYYYRAGSAAAGMSPADLPRLRLPARRLVHLSGITAALSPTADALVGEVVAAQGATVSFDINFRAKLWPVDVAAPRLLALARQANIVLVGRDEAETLWGTATPASIRQLLPNVPTLVVKDSDIGVTEFGADGAAFVPAPRITVVEPIGAGDAFAAGYLTGYLAGAAADTRLRLGHLLAAHALRQVGDSPTALPPLAELMDSASRP